MRADSRAATALVLAVLTACAARAQAAPAENAAAKAAFVEGERNFQLGKFDAAIDAYERAFGADPQPAFLFIALAHRRQFEIDGRTDHLARARELYRNYLRLEPQSGHRAGIEKLIAELTAKIELARGKPEAQPPAPPPAPAAAHPAAPETLAPAVPPPARLAPAAARPAVVLSAPGSDPEPPRSASRKWVIGGTIAAAAVVAAIAIFFVVTRGGPSFDGPGVNVTPDMPP